MPDRRSIVFVDFDGTLCFDRYWRSMEPETFALIQERLFLSDNERVRDWMCGKYSAEEINRWLATELGIPYELLWEHFVADCQSMRVDTQVLEAVHALRGTFYTVLVTGNMDSFTRFTRTALDLDRYFDAIENSYERKLLKDEQEGLVFKLYADRYGVPLAQTHLIDDSTKVCGLFTRIGGTAHLVTAPSDTLSHLKQLAP